MTKTKIVGLSADWELFKKDLPQTVEEFRRDRPSKELTALKTAAQISSSRSTRRIGTNRTVRWYDLRHTMASLLLAQCTNPKIVAERLGDSVEITLSVYSHLIPSMQNDAAMALEK